MKYEAPTLERAETVVIYACCQGTCNGKSISLNEADPDQLNQENEQPMIYAKAG